MEHQKIGSFLKCLRREKGLTQEQLAEQFHVSSRTVSRWETGRNIPDVDMLVVLAEFYDVEIREIIDGERQAEAIENQEWKTLQKVAVYAGEKEKQTRFQVVSVALVMLISLFVCTILFVGPVKGLLYGIIPEHICDSVMLLACGTAGALIIAYLRACWWQEKTPKGLEKTVTATVVSKTVRPGTGGAGRSKGGYSYVVEFQTDGGQTLELYAYEMEFGALAEGRKGLLTYKDRYFVDFQ